MSLSLDYIYVLMYEWMYLCMYSESILEMMLF